MLELNNRMSQPTALQAATDEPSASELLAYAIGTIRRQIIVVLLLAMLGVLLGAVFFLRATPAYTASATLLVDTRKIDILQQPVLSSDMPIQAQGAMESQVELLKSNEVALAVIQKLSLWDDPRFVGNGKPGVVRALLHKYLPALSPDRPPPSQADLMEHALRVFNQGLTVDRVGATYAIEIGFASTEPKLAAQVANGVADAYIDLQRNSGYAAAQQASGWLETRIPELRAKSEAAQRAVNEYKNEYNIVETDKGQLIDEQRVADLSAKLNTARDETLRAKVRSDELNSISSGADDLAVLGSASNGNDFFDKLRSEYLEIASKEADSSTKFGANNPAIVSLRNQKAQLRSEIIEEVQRLKQTSRNDYTAAQLRESEVKKEFDSAVSQSQATRQAQVKLQELEASARAYQDLYNTFLNRYNASLQQAASPIAEASVITPATPLVEKDYKKTYKIAAMFPIAGLALGLGVALLREMLAGRVFRTSKTVHSRLRMPCIGIVPKVGRAKRPRGPKDAQQDAGRRILARGDRGISWTVVDYPFSRFSEGIRSIKVGIDMRSSKVIGVTSAMPNEGKSTVALAVGQLIARNGASVIVVDCDLRNPSLSRSVAPNATGGIVELALREASLESVIWKDPSTHLTFLPSIPRSGPPDPPSLLTSVELRRVFNELQEQFEYVIVDLSPIMPVIDVCATTELIDSYVLVIEWGHTTIDVVQNSLRAAPGVRESVLGAILNKADMKGLSRYDPYVTGYYFQNSDSLVG
jgi:succinoglycan biosynthesis transport protein ExoP